MTIDFERVYCANNNSNAKLVIEENGAIVVTEEMEELVDEAIEIILEAERSECENNPFIDTYLQEEDLDLDEITVVESIDTEPGREIDFRNQQVWI